MINYIIAIGMFLALIGADIYSEMKREEK